MALGVEAAIFSGFPQQTNMLSQLNGCDTLHAAAAIERREIQ
jgi:hypothetical protein